jgi:hypothetical protein
VGEIPKRGKGVLIAHGVWGSINFLICLLLVLAGGGHPPPMIFVPLVAAVWAVGHGVIWVVGWIAARGRRSAPEDAGGVISWPLGLKLALVLTGFASAIGVIQVVVTLLLSELYPFRLPGLWAITLAIWIAHGACFVGLLLRKSWSRLLCAALPLAWAALLAAQIVDHVVRGSPIDPTELAIVVVLILVLTLFGYYLARSSRVRAQFET